MARFHDGVEKQTMVSIFLTGGACPQGSARVIRCLQESREELSYECRATLFDAEVRMAEDIDFKYPMKRACTSELSTFCKGIPHGDARLIRYAIDVLGSFEIVFLGTASCCHSLTQTSKTI